MPCSCERLNEGQANKIEARARAIQVKHVKLNLQNMFMAALNVFK
jgi:hypothetical protein